MEQYFLIWFLILFLGTIIGYFIVKNVLKTVITFLFIVFLFATITIILTYSDIQEMREEYGKKEIVIILHEDQRIIFSAVERNFLSEENKTEYEEIAIEEEQVQRYVALKKYKEILDSGEYYKVFVINKSVYDILKEEIETDVGISAKIDWIMILEDDSHPFEERAETLGILNNAIIKQEGINYFITQYKQGSIIIYPKTMIFNILELIPANWIEEKEEEKN